MKKIDHSNWFIGFVLSVCLLVLVAPLFQDGLIVGDDYLFHLSRLTSLVDTLEKGLFPVKIHIDALFGYSYGYSLFYPNFFLYLPAALMLLGVSLAKSYKIFLFIIIVAQVATTYYASKSIMKNKMTALIPAVLILVSHNYIQNIYYRMALGEVLAFVFLPLLVAGLYDLAYDRFQKPYLLIIGFVGITLSHVITIVVALFFSIVFSLIHIKKIIADKSLLRLLKSALLCLVLTAFYWVPLLEQLFYQNLMLFAANPLVLSSQKCITLFNLLDNGNYTLGSGMVLPLIIVLGLAMYGEHHKRSLEFMIYGILFALLSTEFFKGVWQTIEPYFNIQFPWRLLDIATILLAVGIGLWATCLVEKYQIKNDDYKIILSILLLLVTNFYFDTQRLNYIVSQTMDVKKEELYDNLYSIGFAFEYLPQSLTDYSIFNHADSALGSDGAVIDGTKDGLSFTFKTDGSTYYDIPFIIYKGYTAFDPATLSTDGLAITDSGNGLVRVTVSDTSIAEITVTYQNTTAQNVSYLISGAAALGTLGFLVYQFRKKSRKADSEKTPV